MPALPGPFLYLTGCFAILARGFERRRRDALLLIKNPPLTRALPKPNHIGAVYVMKGGLNSAMEQYKRLMEIDPNFPLAHRISGTVYLKQTRYAAAIGEFQQNVANDRTGYSLAYLGHAYALGGRRDEALVVLKELEDKYKRGESLGQYLAAVYAGLGDRDQAFAWLEKDSRLTAGKCIT